MGNQCFSICLPGCDDQVQNKTRAFGRRLGSLEECLGSCCLLLVYEIPALPSVSLVPLWNPKLFLDCVVTLAWLQGGRLHLTRYQAGACWGASTLQSAPGALNRICCVSSAALPALVDVCAHVALLYHTPADLHRQRNSFPLQASYLTSDI